MMDLGRLQIPTEDNLVLQEELYKSIIEELNGKEIKEDVEIEQRDNKLICHKTKQGVIKIRQYDEDFKSYAYWRFTKKKEFNFDEYKRTLQKGRIVKSMVKCIDDSNCFHLTLNKFYEVVKMNHYLVWIVDDNGDTCQYLRERFEINQQGGIKENEII